MLTRELIKNMLTDHQLRVVDTPGNAFVNACPGSGETRSASARMVSIARSGRRVAACSYSNVSADLMRNAITRDFGVILGPEHYVGTLHGFLLKYVLYPFGHLVTGSDKEIRVTLGQGPELIIGDVQTRMPLGSFCFRPDGSVFARSVPKRFRLTKEQATSEGGDLARTRKLHLARSGFVTADDAMYFSLRCLREFPVVAESVAARFDEVLVDEAQDTSALQLDCLRALIETGKLKSLVLVGDVEQSIYSFNGASPSGCTQLAKDLGLADIHLSENHRSSQVICDVTARFSKREEAESAVGPHADCDITPELVIYDPTNPTEVMSSFSARLDDLGIEPSGAVVLARANRVVDLLNGRASLDEVGERVAALGRVLTGHVGGRTLSLQDVRTIEKVLVYCAWGEDLGHIEPERRWQLRQACMHVLDGVPAPSLPAKAWNVRVRTKVASAVATLTSQPAHAAGPSLRSTGLPESIAASEFFGSPSSSVLVAQTVHDVKGESREAVIVVADPLKGNRRNPAQGDVWSQPLMAEGGSTPTDPEELRIVFVALSRAQRYCALALPSHTPQEVIDRFVGGGFQLA